MRPTVKIYLWLMLLMSIAFGLLYLFATAKMIEPLGYGELSAAALADLQTTFAAFQLAMAVFLWWCLRAGQERTALMCLFLNALAFVLCRGYGLYVDGDRTPMLLGTIALESSLMMISLAFYAWYVADKKSANNATPVIKIVLGVFALLMLGSGIYSVLMPLKALAPMGFGELTPAALTDARASYGGFQIGLGLFTLWCVLASQVFAGALNFLFCIGLVLVCRVYAMIAGNVYTDNLIGAVVFESILTAIALWLVWRLGKSKTLTT